MTVTWIGIAVILAAGAEEPEGVAVLKSALTFHAGFDDSADAGFAKGNVRLFTASSLARKDAKAGNQRSDVGFIKDGRFGHALRFRDKSKHVLFYRAAKNLAYRKKNWSGTVSFWLRLNPDKDLKPGYVDPIQITDKRWNNASFFVDFTKDDKPRHFRLGAFSDTKFWNPKNIKWDKIPADKRPLVTVKSPAFSRKRWTHVVFTFNNFNADGKTGTASLYLDGKLQGTLSRPQRYTWDPDRAAIMIGLSYIGDFDDLAIFNRALSARNVTRLYQLKDGVKALYPGKK